MAKNGEFHLIGHGCNCFGAMGAGIAYQIAQEFPKTNLSYQKACGGGVVKSELLGNNHITFEHIGQGRTLIIANMFTQFNLGRNFDKAALEVCLFKLNKMIRPNEKLGFPWVGCGIGGGNQDEVLSIFGRAFNNRPNVFIVEYKP